MNNISNINDVANHNYTTLFLNRKYDVGSTVWVLDFVPLNRINKKWCLFEYIVTGIIYSEKIMMPIPSISSNTSVLSNNTESKTEKNEENGNIEKDKENDIFSSTASLFYELFSPLTGKIITLPEDKIFRTPEAYQE